MIETPCTDCGGSGINHKTVKIKVDIPAGVDTDSIVTVRGQGEPGVNGGPDGDLYIVVNGALLADYLNVGDEVSIKTTEFYVVVSDDTHGLNVTSNGIASDNLILSDKAVRGDVVMTGARYITSLPNSNICIES